MNEDTKELVTMRATAQLTADALIVSYEVENLTSQSLYLWDQMIGWSGPEKVIDHDSAYTFFEEPATLRLIRADLPLPKLRQIGRKEIPYARALGPQETLTGKITLKQPLIEYSPYYEPMSEDGREIKHCSEIRLLISWTAAKEGMRIDVHTVGGEKLFALRGGWSSPHQEILEQRIPVKVDLWTYTTVFERQMPFN